MNKPLYEVASKRVCTDFKSFHEEYLRTIEAMEKISNEGKEDMRAIIAQIPHAKLGPLVHKTPKVSRMRIQTIPEDEAVNQSTVKIKLEMNSDDGSDKEIPTARSKRAASIKATKSMKKQQSLTLNSKLRRPSASEEAAEMIQSIRSSRSKRPKISRSGSDEENSRRPAKQSKMDDTKSKLSSNPIIVIEPISSEKNDNQFEVPVQSPRQLRKKSSVKSIDKLAPSSIINETLTEEPDITLTESSMYEDAIGKSIPMNSTMNPNTTVTIDRKVLNVTVVLEKMDETRTIDKSYMSTRSTSSNKQSLPIIVEHLIDEPMQLNSPAKNITFAKETPTFPMNIIENHLDELITDDESSPDRIVVKKMKKPEKLPVKKRKKIRANFIDDSDDDVVMGSPMQTVLKSSSTLKHQNNIKYKSNALFSPYAKDSVKKRVEAFEQVRLASPTANVESTGRLTRTKTRAMAANANEVMKTPNFATKLARKSLAKAKKISLAKQKRENEEDKENNSTDSSQKPSKLPTKNDKLTNKQQLRTTPIGKSRLQMPMSVSRIPHTPIGAQLLPPSKAMTASRAHNIASSTESLASFKPLSKSSSIDSLADKKSKIIVINEEDARRKKEEALKIQTEEKRRKREEKELKNKLAREAKEKLEQEKRLKQEKEREEKARNALIMQEKLREEAEKKRLAQLQRAQEKEERRRQEEQLKLQRLQEQEETERQLAEQKRREQEAERRRMAEIRAQQLAAAEAARLKQQYQAKAKLLQQQKQHQMQLAPTSYKLDSDPDDDESDNESQPKHAIPYWAKPQIRKVQLEMQKYIPMDYVLKFFGAKKCTPDLSELFVGIKKERLKRTSSAIWKTPPRFSMMEDDGT
ncbi:hypothetical protein PV327_003600 [Microctonus hyperodae]|uniref:Inner centromere protein ARK-binding domain-containing protein n=1 Tax=Microctonus hyperodae TaxID=165561 RepID=A0AA39G4B1_MICHY|nr:hypothetical protein PV327_003600 [Microctonus hyperodae]